MPNQFIANTFSKFHLYNLQDVERLDRFAHIPLGLIDANGDFPIGRWVGLEEINFFENGVGLYNKVMLIDEPNHLTWILEGNSIVVEIHRGGLNYEYIVAGDSLGLNWQWFGDNSESFKRVSD